MLTSTEASDRTVCAAASCVVDVYEVEDAAVLSPINERGPGYLWTKWNQVMELGVNQNMGCLWDHACGLCNIVTMQLKRGKAHSALSTTLMGFPRQRPGL